MRLDVSSLSSVLTALVVAGLSVVFVSPVTAQQVDTTKLAGIQPRAIGPAGMSGRVTAIDVSPTDKDIWYVGTGSGGLWKTTNGGTTFKPIFDDQPATSIGDVTVHPENPDVLWVGTGEGNPRNSSTGGNGVYKSLALSCRKTHGDFKSLQRRIEAE